MRLAGKIILMAGFCISVNWANAGIVNVGNLLDDPSFTSIPDAGMPTSGNEQYRYDTAAGKERVQIQTSSTTPSTAGDSSSFTASINIFDDTEVTGDGDYDISTTTLDAITPAFSRSDFVYSATADLRLPGHDQVINGWYVITLDTLSGIYTATSGVANIFDGDPANNNAMEDQVISAWNSLIWDSDPFAIGGVVYAEINSIGIEFFHETVVANTLDNNAWFNFESATIGYTAETIASSPVFDPAVSNGVAGDLLLLSGSNYTFGASAVSTFEINKSGTIRSSDKLKTDGTVFCDGTLNVVLLAGSDALEAGDAFDLLDGNITGAITGEFSTVNLPALSGGLEWTTNTLYTQGFIWVRETNTVSVAKPNVIILFADDLGYADTGFQPLGSTDIITPNIDTIAENGVVFTAGYANGPVCSPSRGGLMTGQYQNRFALHDTPATWHMEDPATGEIMHDGIPTNMTCFAHRMQDQGYATCMIGKWHGGETREHYPPHRGFDEFFGFNNGATSYYPDENENSNLNRRLMRGMFPVDQEDEYITDAFGREAADFINRHAHEPFFLYVPFNAPHGPMTASTNHSHVVFGKDAGDLTLREKLITMVYSMDLAVSNILDAVTSNGIEGETLIVFYSDNGGKPGNNESYNTPLRGQKGDLWDGGIRVPFAMQWKGQIPEGLSYDFVVSGLDLMPTAVGMAGGTFTTNDIVDGNDILPAVTGQTATPPNDIVLWWHNDRWVARDNEWKLVDHDKNSGTPPELYYIIDDMSETTDVYNDHPDVVARLYSHYTNTVAEFDLLTDASIWSSNATYYLNIQDPANHVIYEPTNAAEWVESAYPGTDMDNDGISNLQEFLLGLPLDSPSVLSNGLAWSLDSLAVSNSLNVTFRKRISTTGENAIPAPTYNLEETGTLTSNSWSSATAVLTDGPNPTGDPDYVEETYRIDTDPADSSGFYRLKVQE
jgi:arylsulfatase A-like enzyme